MDRLTQLELFVQTVELGSITKAAEALGLSDPAASRHLSALEQRLGARLIERTTRRQWLTEAGRAYHQRCITILAEMAEADAAVNESTVRPRGLLRLTCSVYFAMAHIAPALPEFNRLYPELAVEIVTANRYPDFIEAGIDVAIRTREQEPDSGITVRKLAETRRLLAASPSYLSVAGMPMQPEDLARHRLLIYTVIREPFVFHLKKDGRTVALPVQGALLSNEGQVVCAAARAGAGIVIQPMYTIHEDIVAGRLVPVLEEWELPPLTVTLAYQSRKHQPAKIRVFIEFLVSYFERLQLEKKWSQEVG
jgi:DNA-binding transcriptional LysR family regulator